MMLDGWSHVHNEPIVCVSVTTPDGQSYLTQTVDTSGHGHTADYLQEVAKSAVESAERRFHCKVGSFVTDNASNMVKMRRQLAEDSDRYYFIWLLGTLPESSSKRCGDKWSERTYCANCQIFPESSSSCCLVQSCWRQETRCASGSLLEYSC